MARTLQRLTALSLSRKREPGSYADGGGLYLQVTPANTRSWVYRYARGPKRREMGLGPFPDVSLADARNAAASARSAVKAGRDPLDERKAERDRERLAEANSVTFKEAARQYIDAHKAGWRNAKHAQQWENTLATYAYPELGALSVSAADVQRVLKVLSHIWAEKPETAARVRGRIEAILDYAKARGWRNGDNPARWKGTLDHLLPARAKISRVRHHPAMPYTQVPAFLATLAVQEGVAALALRFGILTAARTGEVIGARWVEMDLDAATWTVPGERMKAGRVHRVALNDAAVAILNELPRASEYVFRGLQFGEPLSNMALLMLLRRMKAESVTVHGFRSSFRDWSAEQTNFPREVIEAALAHASGDKVEVAYLRTDHFEKRRLLLAAWGRFCVGDVATNIVTLRAA